MLRNARFLLLHAIDDHISSMVDAVFSRWMHRDWIERWYAWWSKGEVEPICLDEKKSRPLLAVEIKWNNRNFEPPAEHKSLISFCAINLLHKPVLTTIDGGKRGKWSAAYRCSRIGLRLCGKLVNFYDSRRFSPSAAEGALHATLLSPTGAIRRDVLPLYRASRSLPYVRCMYFQLKFSLPRYSCAFVY